MASKRKSSICDNKIKISYLTKKNTIIKSCLSPRKGWSVSFQQMHELNDDKLLIDLIDFDEIDW